MRTITLHPGSLLAGVGIAVLAFVAMGQQVVSTGTSPRAELDPVVTRPPAFMVHPRDFVQIQEGMPYMVPLGKIFMLTGLGGSQDASSPGTAYVDFEINGQEGDTGCRRTRMAGCSRLDSL